jgi:arsenate reductase (thioredoxin)
MSDRTYNILFLCTGNSARSVLAEVLMNHLSRGRFRAFSAGSHPAGEVNPFTLELLHSKGFATDGLRSKNWDEFARSDAPAMDFVITVCDKAAGEVCPVWPGQPMTAHWGFEDPAAAQGSEEARRKVFNKVFVEIARRIELMLALPIEKLDRLALERQVRAIGQT